MEALICLAILWLLWLVSSKSLRRQLVQPLVAVIVTILIITSPAFGTLLAWGLTAQLPPDSGEHVDAIVVLGRGSDLRADRTAEVWQLWKAKRAPYIFASGMMDAISIVEDLQRTSVPITSLAGEECSQSTEENAIFSSTILHHQQINSILLVTDSLHMWRSFLVFQGVGFNVIPHTVPVSSRTLTQTQWLSMIAREYLGIVFYTTTGKFRNLPPEKLKALSVKARQKIVQWNCKIPRPETTS